MGNIKIHLYRYISFFICLCLLFILFPTASFAASQTGREIVRVGWYEGTYNTTGANGERSGYSYEYQQTVAAYTGWTYEYVKNSWSELLKMLQTGEIDMLGGVSYTDERAENMLFSETPMGEEKYYLYADLVNTDISAADLSTLNGKRIGMLAEGMTTTQFCSWEEKHGLHTQHVTITGADDIRQKLADHMIDGFVLNESPQWEKEGLSAIVEVGSSNNYFVINKDRPELKEELDIAMRKVEHELPFYADDLYKKYLSGNSFEVLTAGEHEWLDLHGPIRIGYVKDDTGVSLADEKSGGPVGIINDYIEYASDYFEDQAIKFKLTGFDSQEKQLQALKDNEIDMIFHVNHAPYEAEQNGIILSKKVFEVNVSLLSRENYFDENAANTIAVSKGNILSKWYISYNYPQWRVLEYDSTDDVVKAVRSGEADGFIIKAGQSSQRMEDHKMRSSFLTKASDSSFAVNRNDTVLLSILNKTLTTAEASKLSGAFSIYENASEKVTLMDFIKDNLLAVTAVFSGAVLLVLLVILHLLMKAKEAQLQAENANAAKSNFLFNMSHDIRTPMNAILGYNELMKKDLEDPKLLDYQEKIDQSGKLLLSIINNVLDMARIESGKTELDESYTLVSDILKKVNGVFDMEVKKKGIHYNHEVDIEHQHIICDVTKVQEIFVNLVGNAVKYTPDGGTITIRTHELPGDREGYACLKTEVIDTGIGMSKEFLPSLFVPFSRERNTTTGKVAGTGLGMPIIKKYIDMMGGTIDVESELGKGTRFTVILHHKIADRVYYDHDMARPEDDGSDIRELVKGRRILLAEDNDLNAEIAVTILEDRGFIVDRVEDGIKCVAKIEHEPPGTYDLILMDIQMPNMDGYKATQAIRRMADKKRAGIPIIAMTANAFEEDRKKAVSMGMNGHIAKPIDIEKISGKLLKILKETEDK